MGGLTHYERLGVAATATDDEILAAYRARVRELHPDLHPDWSDTERDAAETELIEVVLAQQILRDPARRVIYDGAIGADAEATAAAAGGSAIRRAAGAAGVAPGETDEQGARTHEPPPGFRLYGSFSAPPFLRTPRYYRSEWDLNADRLHPGVSLRAHQPDLSPLGAYAPDKLWRLSADRQPITDDELRHLTPIESLTELGLAYTHITDAGLGHIVSLPRLRVLDLWATQITDDGLRFISQAASTLDRLVIGRTRITDAGLVHLRYMHTLDELNLRGTAVRGPGLVHLHGLVTLDRISLPAWVARRHRRALTRALPQLQIL